MKTGRSAALGIEAMSGVKRIRATAMHDEVATAKRPKGAVSESVLVREIAVPAQMVEGRQQQGPTQQSRDAGEQPQR